MQRGRFNGHFGSGRRDNEERECDCSACSVCSAGYDGALASIDIYLHEKAVYDHACL